MTRLLAASLACLLTVPAGAQEPDPWWDPSPVDAGVPVTGPQEIAPVSPAGPSDAPFELKFEADGGIALGRTLKLEAGEVAPFKGRLIDNQEQVRRGKINARNAAKIEHYETGHVINRTPVFIGLILGVAVTSAAAAVLIVELRHEATRPR